MDEVLSYSGKQLEEWYEEYCATCRISNTDHVDSISIIARELFKDKMSIARVAFFLGFIEKLLKDHPVTKDEIYEQTFKCIYRNMKF